MADCFMPDQRFFAVSAVNELFKNIFAVSHIIKFPKTAVEFLFASLVHSLNLIESLLIDNRLMGIANKCPLGFWKIYSICTFKNRLVLSSLHHVTEINRVRKNLP